MAVNSSPPRKNVPRDSRTPTTPCPPSRAHSAVIRSRAVCRAWYMARTSAPNDPGPSCPDTCTGKPPPGEPPRSRPSRDSWPRWRTRRHTRPRRTPARRARSPRRGRRRTRPRSARSPTRGRSRPQPTKAPAAGSRQVGRRARSGLRYRADRDIRRAAGYYVLAAPPGGLREHPVQRGRRVQRPGDAPVAIAGVPDHRGPIPASFDHPEHGLVGMHVMFRSRRTPFAGRDRVTAVTPHPAYPHGVPCGRAHDHVNFTRHTHKIFAVKKVFAMCRAGATCLKSGNFRIHTAGWPRDARPGARTRAPGET